ncbi:Chitinase 2 [Linum perenne]
MLSLGGWSIGDKVLTWKTPISKSLWVSNAFSSLRSLINTYNLDGIDVDYETFGHQNKNIQSFSYCIAPFHTTVVPYMALYRKYGVYIDYVNYQFYTDKVPNPREYVKAYSVRVKEFGMEKLLPSYEVNGRGIQGDAFFESLKLLVKNGFSVNGVMIFSADASESAGGDDKFYYEKKSQAFLLNNTTNY